MSHTEDIKSVVIGFYAVIEFERDLVGRESELNFNCTALKEDTTSTQPSDQLKFANPISQQFA